MRGAGTGDAIFFLVRVPRLDRPADGLHHPVAILGRDAGHEGCQRQALLGHLLGDAEHLGERPRDRQHVAVDRPFENGDASGGQGQREPVPRHQEALLALEDRAARLAPQRCHLDVGAHPRQQLARGERLHEIVVRAGLEALDLRFLAGPCRQEDDRDAGGRRVPADRAQDAETVEAGHHHVGQEQVRRLPSHRRHRGLAIGHRLDPVPLGDQQSADIGTHVGIVVGQHDALSRSGGTATRHGR